MTDPTNYARHRNQKTLCESIRVAIKRTCNTLDLDANDTATKRLVLDALRQVSQVYVIEIDLDVSPALGEPMKEGAQ